MGRLRKWRTYAIDAYTPLAHTSLVAKGGEPGITVVETKAFRAQVRSRMTAEEVHELIGRLALDPKGGVLIQGTGGVRKMRVATRGRGKSGGVRVIYYFHNPRFPLFLLAVFAKNEKDNLTRAERNDIRKLVGVLVKSYGGKS